MLGAIPLKLAVRLFVRAELSAPPGLFAAKTSARRAFAGKFSAGKSFAPFAPPAPKIARAAFLTLAFDLGLAISFNRDLAPPTIGDFACAFRAFAFARLPILRALSAKLSVQWRFAAAPRVCIAEVALHTL
jgi:hypothetical protein